MHRWHGNPLLNNREVTVHKMVQYYSSNNIVAHMHVHIHTQSNNTLHNKTIQNYTVLWVKFELPRNSGVSFSPFSGTKL